MIGTCYGSLMLGTAGLLKGRRATSNSNVVPMLPDVGAVAVGGSDVVIDDTIYTSGPATGSFDASLLVLKALRVRNWLRWLNWRLNMTRARRSAPAPRNLQGRK